MDWDNKKDWVRRRKELYLLILPSSSVPVMSRQRIYDYKKGLWETPKTYVNGYAYNDGSWLIYNTFRVKDGKFHNKVLCMTKKDVILQLYSYLCFLKKIGVSNFWEMQYFAVCHIIWKLTFKKGLWKDTIKNRNHIEKLIKTVSGKEVTCYRTDTRKYCIDPKLKKGKTKGQVTGLQRKKDKELNCKRIEELYNPALSNKQNLNMFKEKGLDISERTLQRWKKYYRGCQMAP